MKMITMITILLLTTSCGKAYKHWVGEQRKIELKLEGEARLLQAISEKTIAIEEAKAELESAKYKSLAEIERAKGVAKANAIIGNSLKGNEGYLRYLYISNLDKAESNGSINTIYIPTEAGLPILEAGRRK